MSSESSDNLWHESVTRLKGVIANEESTTRLASARPDPPVAIEEAFGHYARLYVEYACLLSDFVRCHEYTVQPQKRLDVRAALELVICRVISLRHLLVKWTPPNPDVALEGASCQPPFPWEYFDLDKALATLRISPYSLDLCAIPTYFKEDHSGSNRERNSIVASTPLDSDEDVAAPVCNDPAGSSHVRGGDESTCASSASGTVCTETSGTPEGPSQDQAAVIIQSNFRGHLSRKKSAEHRKWLDNFIGLKVAGGSVERCQLARNVRDIRTQRKQDQMICQANYERDLKQLKDVVRSEEGFLMQHHLREERIAWITDHTISTNTLPDSFEGFYSKDAPPPSAGEGTKEKPSSANKAGGGATKKKKEGGAGDIERPDLTPPQALVGQLKECIRVYSERWQHRNIGTDRIESQSHDVDMAKDLIIRDQVRRELTKDVEEKLMSNILKMKAVQDDGNKKKSKSKTDAKSKKKKKGGGGRKGGKKEKPLPGTKLAGLKDKSVHEMLCTLVQNGLARLPRECKLDDYVGGHERQAPVVTRQEGRWTPNNPSALQLRRAILEYCILPLGSDQIKATIDNSQNVRSVLLYGPEMCGKSLVVEAIASELGALVIDLSSSAVGPRYESKELATTLIHMAFTVAREKEYAPVIILLDNCHEFFAGKPKKGKKADKDDAGGMDMSRFQKDLLIYKNQALKKEDRVLVMGCTNKPDRADLKLIKWKGPKGKPEKQGMFERSLYFPRPGLADRAILWKALIQRRVAKFQDCAPGDNLSLNFGVLASLSDGKSGGQIAEAIDVVLTEERVSTLSAAPLTESEFEGYLNCPCPPAAAEEGDKYLAFLRSVSGIDAIIKARRKAEGAKKKK